eukprot:1148228-Pelagomonas_calceolata.AAC.5
MLGVAYNAAKGLRGGRAGSEGDGPLHVFVQKEPESRVNCEDSHSSESWCLIPGSYTSACHSSFATPSVP